MTTNESSSSAPKPVPKPVMLLNPSDVDATTKAREHYVDPNPLTYRKWEELPYESDEDDCHPNIEIGTWRRLKEKMRREKGIKKKVPEMRDKWNVTTTNKNYHIDPAKAPAISDEQEQKKNGSDEKDDSESNINTNTDFAPKATTQTCENRPSMQPPSLKQGQGQPPQAQPPPASVAVAAAAAPKAVNDGRLYGDKGAAAVPRPAKEVDNEPYKSRSNPQTFLDEHLETVRKFANLKNDGKAQRFMTKHPVIVHEAAEGYLITHAVDRAEQGAEKPELARLSRRCLAVHNLVQSCSTQNVSPEIGVVRFYAKIDSEKRLQERYAAELNKQVAELLERIEVRRIERLAEQEDGGDEYEEEEEKAPAGPGGLDPTEVLNSLPESMQDAFINQDIAGLKQVLTEMDPAQAEECMKRCVDAGLWVQPTDEVDDDDGDDDGGDGGDAVEIEKENTKAEQMQKKQPKIDELD